MGDVRERKMGKRFYKTHDDCEKDAVNLIKEFIKEELKGALLNLKNYSFWNVEKNQKFGNDKTYPDGDCTKIVYAIDYLLYYDFLKKNNGDFFIPGFPYKTNYDFTGETIFTYNTLFGKDSLSKWTNEKVKSFFELYQYLGSFTLLPSKTIRISNKNHSINTWKGDFNNKYHDYFYLYLEELKKYLIGKSCDDKDMQRIFNENSYFSNKKYKDYLEDFYLSGYNDFKFNRNEKFTSNNRFDKNYESFCIDYIDFASKIILQRTSNLVDELNKKLKQYADKTNDTELRSMLYAN